VFTRVRIDATHTDARVLDSSACQCLLGAGNRALDQARRDLGNGVNQTDVRGDVDNLEFRRRQHH
jgi:hypothetical protein